MAVTYYVKYYPTNYSLYPNSRQRNGWVFDSGTHAGNSFYDQTPTSNIADIYTVDSRYDYNTVYSLSNLNSNLKCSYLSPQGIKCTNSPITNHNITAFTTAGWTPNTITTFRDECITFMGNNNFLNWEYINLDLWVQQLVSGSYAHYPVFYAGNNPAYDYTVVV